MHRIYIAALVSFVLVLGLMGAWRSANTFVAQLYLGQGNLLASDGKNEQALLKYDKALARDPRLVIPVSLNKAQVYVQSGDLDSALALCDDAVNIDPKRASIYNSRAVVYLNMGEYMMAVWDEDQAIGLAPGLADAYFNRGTAYAKLDNLERAIEDFDKAIVLSTSKAEPYDARARVYASVGELERAIDDLNRAVKAAPLRAATYYNRGITYKTIGKKAEAIADFEKFISLSTDPEWIEKARQQITEIEAGN